MPGLQILDIGLGLIVVYLTLSLVCTAVNELIAGLVNHRGWKLETGIRGMLGDALYERFRAHPLVGSLGRGERGPSYIPPRTFSAVLLDLLSPAKADWTRTMAQVGKSIDELAQDSTVKRTLVLLMDRAHGDVEQLHQNLETWFNDVMERVSGRYKRHTQVIVLVIATLVCFASNADTLGIADALAHDAALRGALVAQAQAYARDSTLVASEAAARIEKDIRRLRDLGIPLGWRSVPGDLPGWLDKVFGLLLTSFAVSLGAPFWFDMLNKVVNIRSAGRAPERSQSPEAAPQ